jgi:hypothetical protein
MIACGSSTGLVGVLGALVSDLIRVRVRRRARALRGASLTQWHLHARALQSYPLIVNGMPTLVNLLALSAVAFALLGLFPLVENMANLGALWMGFLTGTVLTTGQRHPSFLAHTAWRDVAWRTEAVIDGAGQVVTKWYTTPTVLASIVVTLASFGVGAPAAPFCHSIIRSSRGPTA